MKALRENVGNQLATRGSFYDFMCRQDYFLPERRRALASVDFLAGVQSGSVYLPKQSEVNPVQRESTPSKKDCHLILVEQLRLNVGHKDHGKRISALRDFVIDKDADKAWLLTMIRHFAKVRIAPMEHW